MAKPKHKVDTTWSHQLAYAIGIIASDGNISPDQRHINITSKDREMIINVKKALCIDNKIGRKARGYEKEKKYFVIQFGDVRFIQFLNSIGLTSNKSKTISDVKIPDKYFIDFFRGVIDGDGCLDISHHPESKHPQVRIRIAGASKPFLESILKQIKKLYSTHGGFILDKKTGRVYTLTFAKHDTLHLLPKLYYANSLLCLSRKRNIAEKIMRIA